MKMITNKMVETIPPIYSTDDVKCKDKIAYAQYFSPLLNYDWFVFEMNQYNEESYFGGSVTTEFFGYANLNNDDLAELGYFTLNEFEAINKEKGFQIIERDMYFKPTKVKDLVKQYPMLNKIMDY